MSEWQQVAVCLACNEVVTDDVPFGDLFHVHLEVCPHCGHPKDHPRLSRFLAGWEVKTARRAYNDPPPSFRWWKFWMWGRGQSYWEFQESKAAQGAGKETE